MEIIANLYLHFMGFARDLRYELGENELDIFVDLVKVL